MTLAKQTIVCGQTIVTLTIESRRLKVRRSISTEYLETATVHTYELFRRVNTGLVLWSTFALLQLTGQPQEASGPRKGLVSRHVPGARVI